MGFSAFRHGPVLAVHSDDMTSTPFSSIVASVDFSDYSVRALRHAIALAGHFGGRVTVVHVANPLLVQAATAAYDIAAMNRDTETQLRALADEIATEAGAWAPEIRTIISVGDPATEILKGAKEEDADLIVMGTHGRSGFSKMFFGSVTERVLRLSPVPVLAVPASDHERVSFTDEGPRFAFAPILAPTDLSALSLVNMRVAHSLSATFGAPLLLVHVIESIPVVGGRHESIEAHKKTFVADARERLRTLASEVAPGESVETHLDVGSPAATIAAVAAERNAGLIVMGLHAGGKTFGRRLGWVAYGVLCLVKAPVLALPSGIHDSERLSLQDTDESITAEEAPRVPTHST